MIITLTPEQEKFVLERVQSGQYKSVDDVIDFAFQLLEKYDLKKLEGSLNLLGIKFELLRIKFQLWSCWTWAVVNPVNLATWAMFIPVLSRFRAISCLPSCLPSCRPSCKAS
jgi:hypothetical protein